MRSWPSSDDQLRAMYEGGRANTTARRLSRLWASVFAWGLQPERWVTLEVAARRTGRITSFPLGQERPRRRGQGCRLATGSWRRVPAC